MAEFRINPEYGDWVLVETNGRFWGSLPLAAVSGVDFPVYLFQALVEGRTEFPQGYKIGVYCRNLSLDLRWFRDNLRADRSDPTLRIVPLGRVCAELRNVFTLSEHIDTFALDDPGPFFIEVSELAQRAIGAISRRASRLTGVSRLRKMLRAKRAVRKVGRATTVTFVCYGNICRSPFAEAFARSIAPRQMNFLSAGTFPRADRCSPKEAREAAKGIGIDLQGHRSRVLSHSLIDESDVIIVFDRHNLDAVTRGFPNARSRIVSLGDFLPDVEDEIADPYGQSIEYYEHCFQLISGCISKLWQESTGKLANLDRPTRTW